MSGDLGKFACLSERKVKRVCLLVMMKSMWLVFVRKQKMVLTDHLSTRNLIYYYFSHQVHLINAVGGSFPIFFLNFNG